MDKRQAIHTEESHLPLGIHFGNTTPSGEEQAAGRDVHDGTSRVGREGTTQWHALFMGTDRCTKTVQTSRRMEYIHVCMEVTWRGGGWGGGREGGNVCAIATMFDFFQKSHSRSPNVHICLMSMGS